MDVLGDDHLGPHDFHGEGIDVAGDGETGDVADAAGEADGWGDTDVAGADPRQLLRDQSLFYNVSFEVAEDMSPEPLGWKCAYFGEATAPVPLCEVVADPNAPNGAQVLRLAPQVAAYQDESQFGQQKYLWFDLFAKREGTVFASDFYLFGMPADPQTQDVVFVQYAKGVTAGEGGWSRAWSNPQPLSGAHGLRMVLYNSDPARDLFVDDLVAIEVDDAAPQGAHLLRADHVTALYVSPGDSVASLYIPLPLLHGLQVPLHVELAVTPASAQGTVEYTLDPVGNFGAVVSFPPEAPATKVEIRWTGVVMALDVPVERLVEFNAPDADNPPSMWLEATTLVDSDYPAIAQTAVTATAEATGALEKMLAVIDWTSGNISSDQMPLSLDATTVFESGFASCTGFANLAAAMGRAVELPTRTIANYMVGLAQQTHYVDEFFLGADLGWRLVEPQATLAHLPADYAVLMRINLLSDEGDEAMQTTAWAAPGVPLRSLVRPLQGAARLMPGWPSVAPFPECPVCDNKATYQASIQGSPEECEAAWQKARVQWQKTLEQWTANGPTQAELQTRAKALDAQTLSDLQALLEALQ